MLVVFDLDGTLADHRHRLPLIQGNAKDYDAYYAACGADEPYRPAIHALRAHTAAGHRVEIWTGRREDAAFATLTWMRQYQVAVHLIRMRPMKDTTPNVDFKRALLHKVMPPTDRPALVYDDHPGAVQMWRAEGVPCFQVEIR